ncbi:Rho termination factor N-terminal domain-containing protein [Billgrantia saliphila]|uniref:Rho termination factor N-terminal domain-containing protein n=1 Tax=Billgrantia saliphila TaxID=1848458 RepID=UPI000CE52AC5|nr:Rho termination factor N-terminal domain-containing protein [Halomonas saliphila]
MSADDKRKTQGYDRFKQHQGEGYSGMKVGRSHKWHYDQGEWRERKLSPDEWEIYYQTTKRRAARAPEESGAPIGTEYNWLIVSHQRVDKLDANSYMTCMEGKKFKVAHKRASNDAWNVSEKSQRKKVIEYLEQMIEELKEADESEPLPYSVGEHRHVYGLNLRTKTELLEMAKEYGLSGTSKMKRAELLAAVKECVEQEGKTKPEEKAERHEKPNHDGHAARKPDGDGAELQGKSKDELYRLASERDISGRSSMSKAELVHALAGRAERSGTSSRA